MQHFNLIFLSYKLQYNIHKFVAQMNLFGWRQGAYLEVLGLDDF